MNRVTTSRTFKTRLSIVALALATIACTGDSPRSEAPDSASTQPSGTAAQSQPGTAPPRIDIGVAKFDQLRAGTDALVLDVRTPKEFSDGHVPDAQNIDIMAAGFAEAASKFDKDSTVLVYCRSGRRSLKAASTLRTLGFTSVHNLEGGYVAWAAERSD